MELSHRFCGKIIFASNRIYFGEFDFQFAEIRFALCVWVLFSNFDSCVFGGKKFWILRQDKREEAKRKKKNEKVRKRTKKFEQPKRIERKKKKERNEQQQKRKREKKTIKVCGTIGAPKSQIRVFFCCHTQRRATCKFIAWLNNERQFWAGQCLRLLLSTCLATRRRQVTKKSENVRQPYKRQEYTRAANELLRPNASLSLSLSIVFSFAFRPSLFLSLCFVF